MNETERLTNNLCVDLINWVKSEKRAHDQDNPGEPFMIGYRPGISEDRLEYLVEQAEKLIERVNPS